MNFHRLNDLRRWACPVVVRTRFDRDVDDDGCFLSSLCFKESVLTNCHARLLRFVVSLKMDTIEIIREGGLRIVF